MVLLYTVSTLYHALNVNRAKVVFRVLDHCTIFLLIAGTYTPIALCTMRERILADGWILFGIIWGLALIGVALNSVDLKKYKKFSMICYLVMGWCIIVRMGALIEAVGMTAFWFLLAGGIAYTIGAVCYGIAKKKWMHSVFHVFCIIGSVLHFLFILFYIIL